jgi:molybdopterin converting factor small subunit
MTVRILFFGATADETGNRAIDIAIENYADVTSALNQLLVSFPGLNNHKLRFAVNEEYVSADRILEDGDQLAVFTAVSGG